MSSSNLNKLGRFIPLFWLGSVAVWFWAFPVKASFSQSDILFEGVYLLAALISFFLVQRLGEWKLIFGWGALCEGLLFDFLDEFTLEAGSRLDVDAMQDIATTVGLLLMTFGFLAAVSRREHERDRVQESAQALEQAREHLASILESVSDALVVTDAQGAVRLLNARAYEIFDLAPGNAEGCLLAELLALQPQQAQSFRALLQDAEHAPHRAAAGIELQRELKERPQTISVGVSRIRQGEQTSGLVWVMRDVTSRREQEVHLQQASRLESVGLLAGGVAHDFNNLLSAVMNWVSFSEVSDGGENELRETFGEIRKACKRGKRLANQLLTFAKGGEPVVAPTDLGALVREEAVFALRGSRVSPHFQEERDLAHAEVDPVQIGQVVQNLVINAKQAMAAGGRVEIGVGKRVVTVEDALPLDPGEYLQVWVQDEGSGIFPSDLERVFDPYFSRKEGGSGLGLATSYAIVRRHGGHIWAETPAAGGSCIRFLLPQSVNRAVLPHGSPDGRLFHGRAVLVVDDDYSVQKPLVGTLRAIGFDVEACLSGADAVQLYHSRGARGGSFDLVLMDLTLQGEAGGAETMQRILEFDPKARGIVMSGYHEDPVMANHRTLGFLGMMQKPFDYAHLVSEMGRVLGMDSNQEQA